MRKITVIAALLGLACSTSWAAWMSPEESRRAHREEMTKIKKAQREAAPKKADSGKPASTEPTFWEKEGKRSGMDQMGPNIGNFASKFNPLRWGGFFKEQERKYNERKAQAVAK